MKELENPRKRELSGNALKMIAIISMLIDHVGVALVENGILKFQDVSLAQTILATPQGKMWSTIDFFLRTTGRIAFPIFCFLLVEGFIHTRNIRRYGFRLLMFAVISEIPFDLALFDQWFYPQYQNVFFTLLIGLWVLEWYQKTAGDPLKQTLVVVAGAGASVFLKCDYNIIGILMILLFYVFYNNKKMQTIFAGGIAALSSMECMGAGILAIIPIRMYNGERGKRKIKFFFYWFYPVHLLLLFLLRVVFIK